MKYIKLVLFALWAVIFLSACGGSGKGKNNVADDPTDNTATAETVKINETVKNSVYTNHIDLTIKLPAGTTQSLLDYSGSDITISGSMNMLPPCVKGSHSFSCTAQLSGGTISAQNCSIGHGIQLSQIILFRTKELKTTYSIQWINFNPRQPPYNCFLNQ